jgi:hypothetical protein
MKKRYLALTLILSTQLLFAGCDAISLKPTPDSSTEAKTETPKTEETEKKTEDSSEAEDKTTETASTESTSTNTANTSKPNKKLVEKTEGVPSSTGSSTSTKTTKLANLAKKDVQTYSSMKKTELIKTLGDDYKSVGSTFTFSNGLLIDGLHNNNSTPSSIKVANNVTVMGIKNGMTFEKVQSILGKTEVVQTYIGSKENIVYKVQYSYGQGVIKVISPNKDGQNSYIQIVPQ